MSNHLLLDNMVKYSKGREKINVNDYQFNSVKGYWEKDSMLMIHDNQFKASSTSKEDIETGADYRDQL